jgi:hypothetical protein
MSSGVASAVVSPFVEVDFNVINAFWTPARVESVADRGCVVVRAAIGGAD